MRILSQNRRVPGSDINMGPPEYKKVAVTTGPQRSSVYLLSVVLGSRVICVYEYNIAMYAACIHFNLLVVHCNARYMYSAESGFETLTISTLETEVLVLN
jgi:hypothetical protein